MLRSAPGLPRCGPAPRVPEGVGAAGAAAPRGEARRFRRGRRRPAVTRALLGRRPRGAAGPAGVAARGHGHRAAAGPSGAERAAAALRKSLRRSGPGRGPCAAFTRRLRRSPFRRASAARDGPVPEPGRPAALRSGAPAAGEPCGAASGAGRRAGCRRAASPRARARRAARGAAACEARAAGRGVVALGGRRAARGGAVICGAPAPEPRRFPGSRRRPPACVKGGVRNRTAQTRQRPA